MALAVKSTMNNDHLKTLDAILKEPLSGVRMKLHQHMQGFTPAYKEMMKQKDPAKAEAISGAIQQAADEHFNEGHFNDYMAELRKFAQDDLGGQNLAAFDREVAKAREAIETGDTTFEPNPSVRVNQMVWAVTLSYLTVNPKAQEKWADKNKAFDVTDTKVWNKVLESDTLEDELLDHAFHLSEEITNKNTKLRWGAPGSWFYNNREEPAINLDLIESLTLGLEHTRAAAYHEMGHNKLTVKLPESMLNILGKLEEQDEKVEKGHKLTEDEYVERQKLAAEMQARHKIFNACEDNTVNQYAVRQSVSLDYSVSINYTNVLLAGTGTLAQAVRQNGGEPVELKEDPAPQHGTGEIVSGDAQDVNDAQKKFGNLQHAINMSFFQNNGLFADTEKGWKSVNVHTDWITEDPTYPSATGQTSEEALKHLQSLCRQLEDLQPARNAKRFGEDAVKKMIPDLADKRIAIYEEIWDRYAKQFAEPLIEKAEEQAKENADQQQGDGKDGDPSDQKSDSSDKSDKSDQQKGDKSDKSDKSDESDKSDKSDKSDSSDKSDDQQNDKENDGQDAKDGEDKSDQKDQQKQDGQDNKDKSDQQQDGQDNKDQSDDQQNDKENDGQDAKDGQDKSDQKDQQKQDGQDNKDKSDQQQDGDKSDSQEQDDQPSDRENDGQDAKDGQDKSDQKDQQKQDKSDQQKGDQGQQQDRDDDTVPVEDKGDLPDNASKENRPKDPVKEEEKRQQAEQEAKEKAEQEAKDKAEQDGQDSKDGNEKENDGQDAKDGEEKDGQEKGDEQDGDEKGDQKQEGEGQDAKDGEEKGEGQEGEGQEGEGQEGEGQEGEGQEGEGQDAKDGEGKDGKSKDGRTLDELNKEREQRQKDAAEKAAKEAAEKQKKKQQAEEGEGEGQGEGSGSGHSLAELKVGDWRNYDEMKREYAAPIREMSNILLKIREKKVIYQKERSREHSLKPEDGKLGRFDGEKYTNRIKKERTGQDTTAEDYKTFRKDQMSPKPAPDDIVIAIDLSGSMASGGDARRGSRPVDIAVQIACIMREAGKKADTNVYILGWGEKGGGRWIATPDMDDKQIGDNIDGIKDAANWGTDFAPAVNKIVDMYIDEKKGAHSMVGDTHIVVASDGDLFDEKQSNIIVSRLLKSCPNVTMDVAIINKDKETNMGKMVQVQKGQRHHRQINVTNTTGAQESQDKMREVMTERLRVSAESEAIAASEKQIRFKQAKRGAVMDGFGR